MTPSLRSAVRQVLGPMTSDSKCDEVVRSVLNASREPAHAFRDALDLFTTGYAEALIADIEMPATMDCAHTKEVCLDDLSSEARAEILRDCGAMVSLIREKLTGGPWAVRKEDGASFWRQRNGEYAFLDHGIAHAKILRALVTRKRFPPLTVTLGDDGLVYLAPSSASPNAGESLRDEP